MREQMPIGNHLKMKYLSHGKGPHGRPECYYLVWTWGCPEITYRINFGITGAYVQKVNIPKGEQVNTFIMAALMDYLYTCYKKLELIKVETAQ